MFRKSILLSIALTAPLLLAGCNLTKVGATGTRSVDVRGLAGTENCLALHIIRQEENRPQSAPYIIKEKNDPGYFFMVSNDSNLKFDVTCVKGSAVTGRSVLTFKVKADKPGRTPTPVNVKISSPELVEGTPSRMGYTVVEGQYPPLITVTFPE